MSARCSRSATRYDLVQFVHAQAGLQDHHSGSPTRTRRRPKLAKSGIFTGLEAGLDGVPQVGVLDFEPDRYVGRPRIRADAGLRGTCAGWAKVRLKTRHYREQQTKECVSHVPRGRATAGTRTTRHYSGTGRTVSICAQHTSWSHHFESDHAVPGLNRLAFIERIDSRNDY